MRSCIGRKSISAFPITLANACKKQSSGLFFADVIRNYIHTGVCFKIDYSAFFETATQISKAGTNINQIAKAVNETRSVTKYQVMSLQKDMKKIEEILTEAVQSKAHVSRRLSEDYFRGGTHGSNKEYDQGGTHGNDENHQG